MKRSICLPAFVLASAAATAASAAPALDCAALTGAVIDDTQITLAVLNPATATTPECSSRTSADRTMASARSGHPRASASSTSV